MTGTKATEQTAGGMKTEVVSPANGKVTDS